MNEITQISNSSLQTIPDSFEQELNDWIAASPQSKRPAREAAAKGIGKDLVVVMKSGNIPKFLMSTNGLIFASQSHLEETWDGEIRLDTKL